MSTLHPSLPGAPRLVVDPGVLVSAAISGAGPPDRLLWLVMEQRLVLVVSPLLLDELREVLARPKFRRYLRQDDADAFALSVEHLALAVPDSPEDQWPRVCRDPDDDYLVALSGSSSATMLVSGDKDLRDLVHAGTDVRTPRDAVEALEHLHPWGPAVIPGDEATAWRHVAAEGSTEVLVVTARFINIMERPGRLRGLRRAVTPESLGRWRGDRAAVRQVLQGRGMATRPERPSPGVAYVKLPHDPGRVVKATGEIVLPTTIVTLQQRLDLPHDPGSDGWRVHAIGDYVLPEDLPPTVRP